MVTIYLGNNPNSATLAGVLSAATAANGIAAFSNLSVNNADNGYTLVASVGALTAVSNPFNITAGNGNIVTVAGSNWFSPAIPPAGILGTNYPISVSQGVAYDSLGNLYVADSGNQLVEKITPAGTLTIVAGTGVAGFAGDGGLAVNAQISDPLGVAVDANNNVYIADASNSRIRKVDTHGIITTFAGSGTSGFAGDGGPAIAAWLNSPRHLAFDSAGNLYIADLNNNRIRKVSGGIISTVAGNGAAGFGGDGGAATSAILSAPEGIAVDNAGNLYIADTNNQRVRKVSGGIITTVAGTGVAGFSGDGGAATSATLNAPYGVALDSSGSLYIADDGNSRIRKVSGGIITTFAGNSTAGWSGDGGPAANGSITSSQGLAFDPTTGNLAFNDSGNRRIRTVNVAGNLGTLAGNGMFEYLGDNGPATAANMDGPWGAASDSAGNLYITDALSGLIRKVDATGKIATIAGNLNFGYAGDGGPASAAVLQQNATYGTTDVAGNFYFSDRGNSRVRKIDTAGNISTFAGGGSSFGDGGPATAAQISVPRGLAFDSAGNSYVADKGDSRIRKVTPSGTIGTIAGNGTLGYSGDNGPALNAEMNDPEGLAVDSAGNVYFADAANNRVRIITPSGYIATFAGNGTNSFSGDGGAAVNAGISSPQGVAVDAAGNVYISRWQQGHCKVDLNGVITTVGGNATCCFSGDGGLATSARINNPRQLWFNAAGDLYIVDAGNNRIRKIFGLGSIVSGSRLTITTTTLPSSFLNTAYPNTALAAVGGAGNLTWGVSGGALPTGLTLSGAGFISGTPTATGSFTFTVQVTDSGVPAHTAFAILNIVVIPAGSTLSFAVQPGDTAAAQAITPAVQVKLVDSNSNAVANANIAIAMGNNPANGTLAGTLTAITNANGIATFSTLSINAVGTGYTLAASIVNLITASASFNVLATAPNITTVAGSTWTPPRAACKPRRIP